MSPRPRTPRPRGRTGPLSQEGKKRSSLNAVKHGLAVPISHDVALSAEAAALAHQIAGSQAELLGIALEIAEAELAITSVRRLRSEAIDTALRDPRYTSSADAIKFFKMVASAVMDQTRMSDAEGLRDITAKRQESRPERHARILEDLAKKLASFDRYERRALSSRKFAIRRFDSAAQVVGRG